jgi:hypothetical protein
MLSRATLVYLLMLLVFGLGLWAILSVGAIWLRAPADLAGRWKLIGPEGAQHATEMRIEQSGRYFYILVGGKRLDLKVQAAHVVGSQELHLRLAGGEDVVTFRGPGRGDDFEVVFEGSHPGRWHAKRISRTYKQARASAPASLPARPTAAAGPE